MLTINLVPFEELENKHWYLPDLLLALVIGGGAALLFNSYVDQYKSEISTLQSEVVGIGIEITSLMPRVERYLALTKEAEQLHLQLSSLERITSAKVPRFRPVILLEKLQKLKPAGLWFKNLSEQTSGSTVALSGESFDKLLVAQFIAALNSSYKNAPKQGSLAEKIDFVKVNLRQLSEEEGEANPSTPKEKVRPIVRYELMVKYQEQPEKSTS
jgi:hypothetical protein